MFEVVITSDVPCLWSHGMIIEKVMNNNCVQASMNGQEVGYHFWAASVTTKIWNVGPEHPANRIFMSEMNKKQTL